MSDGADGDVGVVVWGDGTGAGAGALVQFCTFLPVPVQVICMPEYICGPLM